MWQGEPTIPKAFGFPGYKALIAVVIDLLNAERNRHSANFLTMEEVLPMIEAKIEEFKDDVTED